MKYTQQELDLTTLQQIQNEIIKIPYYTNKNTKKPTASIVKNVAQNSKNKWKKKSK